MPIYKHMFVVGSGDGITFWEEQDTVGPKEVHCTDQKCRHRAGSYETSIPTSELHEAFEVLCESINPNHYKLSPLFTAPSKHQCAYIFYKDLHTRHQYCGK